MDLNLTPVFYHQVSSLTQHTMKLLPSHKGTQKVVIGDQDGVVTTFYMKRGNCQIIFKTLPGTPISSLQLNGPPGALHDKIFISSGAEVKGYSKKGKQFLKFDTNLTEPIRTMCVNGNNLFTAGSYVYNHYINCQDTNYFLSSDVINSILPINANESIVVLACQDCALRVLKDSSLLYELEVAGPPTALALDQGSENECGILYGTQDGRLGLVKLDKDSPEYCWDMINEHKYGGINSIACYDICDTGIPDIILGRADGIVQVFTMDENNQPTIQFTHNFGESIASVAGGCITSSLPEVVVSTYSGKIYGLVKGSTLKTSGTISDEVKSKIDTLKLEVSKMESQLSNVRSEYQSLVKHGESSVVSALPQFCVNDSFTLIQDEAWYSLAVETQTPIDFVVLQSNVPIDLEEVEKSSAVISYTEPDVKNGNYLLATCRCNGTNRLEVKVRSIEGQYGTLRVYITPKLEPKSCQLKQYPIKPLSLHQRAHTFDESLPVNTLEVTGSFSLSDVHSWIMYCLPDVPDHPVEGQVTTTLQYKSQYTGTQLQCLYSQGKAKFVSDNLSTISVIKEVLSKEATKKKIQVNISHVINDSSVPHILRIIHPRLEDQMMLAKNIQLIEPLKELQIHEGGEMSFLAPQCQYILDNCGLMQQEIKKQPAMIDRYYALITDLFMDRASFKGQNARSKVPDLLKLLDNCDLHELIEFFNSST